MSEQLSSQKDCGENQNRDGVPLNKDQVGKVDISAIQEILKRKGGGGKKIQKTSKRIKSRRKQ